MKDLAGVLVRLRCRRYRRAPVCIKILIVRVPERRCANCSARLSPDLTENVRAEIFLIPEILCNSGGVLALI